jgi:hypothetical protein
VTGSDVYRPYAAVRYSNEIGASDVTASETSETVRSSRPSFKYHEFIRRWEILTYCVNIVEFKFLTAMVRNSTIFWDITPCPLKVNRLATSFYSDMFFGLFDPEYGAIHSSTFNGLHGIIYFKRCTCIYTHIPFKKL